jgi:hypothetical protein
MVSRSRRMGSKIAYDRNHNDHESNEHPSYIENTFLEGIGLSLFFNFLDHGSDHSI